MTTYSRSDLATRVLKDLGLVGADETPTSADLDWAEETIASETAMLAAKGIPVANGNDQALPLEYLTLLSRRIGLAIAPSFGLADMANAQLAMAAIEKDLRILCAKPATGEVMSVDYF